MLIENQEVVNCWLARKLFLTHSWEPCQAAPRSLTFINTKTLKYNSTKTGQEDETESRKSNKKEYIVT